MEQTLIMILRKQKQGILTEQEALVKIVALTYEQFATTKQA